jgi:hypothetical protein
MKITHTDGQICKISSDKIELAGTLETVTYDKLLTDHLNSSPNEDVRTKYIKSLRASNKIVRYDNQYSEIAHKPVYRVYSR